MCGIAGLSATSAAALPPGLLDSFLAALAHRGPDGGDSYSRDSVGLAHRRLAIIDLVSGDQPLLEPQGAALIANGEIYNFKALRQSLPGVAWTSSSDCEPPLYLYRRHGLAAADHLRGMYALALHDPQAGALLLLRDPFGIKPLYIAETTAGLAFASEPQVLVETGLVAPKVRARSRDELLQLRFTTGADTIFDGIQRVLPGETLLVKQGRIVERRHRAALPEGPPETLDEGTALARLDAVLTESVELHCQSDVPYGLFLSGGIDSSALLALMARRGERVLTFTAGFAVAGAADERLQARAMAQAVGAQSVEVEVGESDFWNHLPAVAACLDDPVADYAALPTWLLARRAREDVKVVLSGEGGDEIFAGYGRYRKAMRPWWAGRRSLRSSGTFDGLEVLRAAPEGWRDGLMLAERGAALPGRTRLMAAQATDCADWLTNGLLVKLDRCLMAHGVEGRVPYLDDAVARFGFLLPDRLKVRDGRGKWLLRQWLARNFPAAQPFAPKQGFTVPVGAWIAARGERVGQLVARDPAIRDLAHPDRVERLFRSADDKRHGFAAWTLLFYALWHRRHIRRQPLGGDVFETLSQA